MSNLKNLEWGKRIATARNRRGISQAELGKRIGLDQTAVSRLEAGSRSPNLPQLIALTDVLECPIQYFLTGTDRAGSELGDIVVELRRLGIVDLLVSGEAVPGAFRPPEEVLALALKGDQPPPRVTEAIPAVLAWNSWDVRLLEAYANRTDPRVLHRIAWLADVALTIHRGQGFPGGCPSERTLEELTHRIQPAPEPDSLGRPTVHNAPIPPVSRRWNVIYAAPLAPFRERAKHLHDLRRP
jgi:transcriptional regulator with XRE-family HTH domain